MALVRYTCVTSVQPHPDGDRWHVVLPDPCCPYVVHRLVLEAPSPEPA